MDAYIYQSDLLCEDCVEGIKATLDVEGKTPQEPNDESSYDSSEYPKGPYSNGGGEADCPQRCGACGIFLENPLTRDGYLYILTHHREEWDEFYKAGNAC